MRKKIIYNLIKEFIKKNFFILNKCYEYDDLDHEIQTDIDVQFKIFDEDPDNANDKFEGFPTDYVYCFKYLKPNELNNYFPLMTSILKSKTHYLDKLKQDIQKNGLQYPPVGNEGNHRAAVFWLLNKNLPYLEIKKKSENLKKNFLKEHILNDIIY